MLSDNKLENNLEQKEKNKDENIKHKGSYSDEEYKQIRQNSNIPIRQNSNIPIFDSLYPPIKESFVFDENNEINNNILKLNRNSSRPQLRYKNALSSKVNNLYLLDEFENGKTSPINDEEEDEDLKVTDQFLEDLLKIPCPISKAKIISIISHFIRKSKLIEKIEHEYQSDKKADLNNLSILCAENLSYIDLKKGGILFKIGEEGNKFFIIFKGIVSILKLKEIPVVKMTFYEYFNYCIKLLKDNEIFILEELLKKNHSKVPLNSIEDLEKLCKIMFQKKLYENVKKQLILNVQHLLQFFSVYDQSPENFDLPLNELQLYEQLDNDKEWKNLVIRKIKPKKDELVIYEQYERYINSSKEIIITTFCYEPFLYLGPGFFFGDNALEKGVVYTGNKRNATIRAETDVVLGWLNSADYIDIIAPKRRLEKLKEINFLLNNFFFKEISIHIFEKNYFHLFSACEYRRGNILFSTGVHPKALVFIKEGRISLELKTSIFNIQKLIKYLYEYIFTNPLFLKLSPSNQKKVLNDDSVKNIKTYIDEPVFKKLRGFSQKFVDELSKNRQYKIALIADNDTIGLEEIFLGIPYIMKGCANSKKVLCYEIKMEHIQKIIHDEKQIMIPFIKSSINKIFSLIERLQNIKQHYIKCFIKRYENGIVDEKITNSSSMKNLINNIHDNNFDKFKNSFELNIEDSETNNNDMINDNEINKNLYLSNTNFNNINANKSIFQNQENSQTIYISNNRSPLKRCIYLRPDSKNVLMKLEKNKKRNAYNSFNIKIFDEKNKKKSRNYFNSNSKFELQDSQRNSEFAKTYDQQKELKEIKTKRNFDDSEKKEKEKAVLIKNKYFSLEKLKNKFNELDLQNNKKREIVNVIQSNKYSSLYNKNEMKNNNSVNSISNNYETKKEFTPKGIQRFLNYHLSYVPLISLTNKNYKEEKLNYNSFFKNKSNEKSSPSLNSSKANTKCHTFRNKVKNKNFIQTFNNNSNFKETLKSFSEPKENLKSKNNLYDNGSETNRIPINEKIKDFYKDMKLKGYLSLITNIQNNTFFLRKFNKKYISAMKKNISYKENKVKTVGTSSHKILKEIKEL